MKVFGGTAYDDQPSSNQSKTSSSTLQNDNIRKTSTSTHRQNMKQIDRDNSSKKKIYPSWHNIVAGAAAGAGARFFTAPLDLIKIRRQLVSSATTAAGASGFASFTPLGLFYSFRDIVRNEGGLSSLFRGNLAATVSGLHFFYVDQNCLFFKLLYIDQR